MRKHEKSESPDPQHVVTIPVSRRIRDWSGKDFVVLAAALCPNCGTPNGTQGEPLPEDKQWRIGHCLIQLLNAPTPASPGRPGPQPQGAPDTMLRFRVASRISEVMEQKRDYQAGTAAAETLREAWRQNSVGFSVLFMGQLGQVLGMDPDTERVGSEETTRPER